MIPLIFLGSLDEIASFSFLLVGGVFSGVELCLGTHLAAIIILVIVMTCLRPFQHWMKVVDRIPLYGVVGTFALFSTSELVCGIL